VYNAVMDTVKWKLKEFLEQHNLSAYQLVDKAHGGLSRTGVYRLTDSDVSGVRFESLAAIIPALRELTGEEVQIGDLLEYVGEPPAPDARRSAWRRLRGALDDPDSPGDVAERHDHYLGEALHQEHQEGVEGKR
jgi:DNA-binding Xre family transcriptional regulator